MNFPKSLREEVEKAKENARRMSIVSQATGGGHLIFDAMLKSGDRPDEKIVRLDEDPCGGHLGHSTVRVSMN